MKLTRLLLVASVASLAFIGDVWGKMMPPGPRSKLMAAKKFDQEGEFEFQMGKEQMVPMPVPMMRRKPIRMPGYPMLANQQQRFPGVNSDPMRAFESLPPMPPGPMMSMMPPMPPPSGQYPPISRFSNLFPKRPRFPTGMYKPSRKYINDIRRKQRLLVAPMAIEEIIIIRRIPLVLAKLLGVGKPSRPSTHPPSYPKPPQRPAQPSNPQPPPPPPQPEIPYPPPEANNGMNPDEDLQPPPNTDFEIEPQRDQPPVNNNNNNNNNNKPELAEKVEPEKQINSGVTYEEEDEEELEGRSAKFPESLQKTKSIEQEGASSKEKSIDDKNDGEDDNKVQAEAKETNKTKQVKDKDDEVTKNNNNNNKEEEEEEIDESENEIIRRN